MFLGFIIVVGSAIFNWGFDEIIPELTDLGVVGGANFTEAASYTLEPLNDVVQSFTWLAGIMYIFILLGVIIMPFMFRGGMETWLIGFFFVLMLLLIIASMFMSNIYEEFYDDTGELADRLKEHVLLSFLVLHSPIIFTVISFIGGLVLFAGIGRDDLT